MDMDSSLEWIYQLEIGSIGVTALVCGGLN